ncbi:MAG: FAD-binding oxidoreductase [Dehalococcoidia bacterium]|nr:FAD-binding oxidoreductase [Dehalococcoidia bacterium]
MTLAPAHLAETRDLEAELRRAITGEVRFDAYSRTLYSTDASIYRIEPVGVVLPRNADEVSAIIEICHRNGVKVLPRGGGTGLSGQTVNHAVVIDFTKYMHALVEVNPQERWAVAQPGITLTELNRQVAEHGLFYTPDPSTVSRATIGGGTGNNSCGAHSIIFGKTVDQVLSLDVVLSDGATAHFGPVAAGALDHKLAQSGLEGQIYRRVRDVAQASRTEVDRRFPKILRRVGGYNLDLVIGPNGMDLSRIAVGSEGTLVAVTQAKVRLEPVKKFKGLAILHFKSLQEAMEATVATLEERPSAVEHIGAMIITQARKALGFARNLEFLQGEPTDILVVEFDGDSEAEVASRLDALDRRISAARLGYATTRLTKPSDQQKVWHMRESGLGLMMNVPGDAKPLPFVEDTAVSPEKLPEFVRRFDEIVRSAGTEAGYYGHASVGCLHVRPVINLKKGEDVQRMYRIADEVSSLVLEFGGANAAEHGDGIVRGYWNEKMFGPQLAQAFREVKKAFDPKGIMNPGKIIDTPHMTENLRYDPSYSTQPVKERLDFSDVGGFTAAVEKCNGVGACRKLNIGAMCPSYIATREEEHSTRGRANALRSALSGALPFDQLYSKRMFDVLDLCLECKSCKAECPSQVDMAKVKYEWLNTYYKTHKMPLRSRLVAGIHRMNSLAQPVAPLANIVNRSAPVRWALDRFIGVDRRRKFPKLAHTTFEAWFRQRRAARRGQVGGAESAQNAPRGKVVFFHDTFTNFNHPQAGISTVGLLEALGYEVVTVPRKCCGRPMISKGMLDRAAANARHNVDVLHPLVEAGAKVVGCEASCMGAIKDEYPDLLKGDPRAKAVAKSVLMIEELLAQTAGDGQQQIEWSADARKKVALQVHCHERALVGTQAALKALSLPPGYQTSLINAGCCGMAGSFGFEKEHYDISMKVGEDRLFPAIRAASPDTEVAVTGVSCRQQIEDATGRPARFLPEVLADAMKR